MLYVLVPYVAVAAIVTLFQRSLIYHPTSAAEISVEDVHLPRGVIHDISVNTADGLTLGGWHLLADGRQADSLAECDRELALGRPLVIYFPGNALNRTYRVNGCRDFTQLGADVFLFDYRGFGENSGYPTEKNLVADAMAIWKYATDERGVSPDRIVVFGQSLGGGVATQLAAEVCRQGTPPAALILSSTFSSMTDAASNQYPFLPVRWLLFDPYPSVEHVTSVTCPLLQIHGDADRIVPIELGRKLFDAAPAKSTDGHAKRFVSLADTGHNNIPPAVFRDEVANLLQSINATKIGVSDSSRPAAD